MNRDEVIESLNTIHGQLIIAKESCLNGNIQGEGFAKVTATLVVAMGTIQETLSYLQKTEKEIKQSGENNGRFRHHHWPASAPAYRRLSRVQNCYLLPRVESQNPVLLRSLLKPAPCHRIDGSLHEYTGLIASSSQTGIQIEKNRQRRHYIKSGILADYSVVMFFLSTTGLRR